MGDQICSSISSNLFTATIGALLPRWSVTVAFFYRTISFALIIKGVNNSIPLASVPQMFLPNPVLTRTSTSHISSQQVFPRGEHKGFQHAQQRVYL